MTRNLCIPLAIAVANLPLLGQATCGAIIGTITDTTGAVIPKASVTVTNQGTNITKSALTDQYGNYEVTHLNAGNYSVDRRLRPGQQLRERAALRFQASFTNLFNHPNFDVPNLNISASGSVAKVRSIQKQDLAGPRSGLIGARIDF